MSTRDPLHLLVLYYIKEHYCFTKPLGYMGTGVGHKALYHVHTPEYIRARDFEVIRNHETSKLKGGVKEHVDPLISKELPKEKLPSCTDYPHDNSKIIDGRKQTNHQANKKGWSTEKLSSWSDVSHNNSSITNGWKELDHQSTSKGKQKEKLPSLSDSSIKDGWNQSYHQSTSK